ncbi:N-acetylmuramoyl-L-alanine amidase CwlD [Bacillus sp. JZ8]
MKKKLWLGTVIVVICCLFLGVQHYFTNKGSIGSWSLPLSGKIIVLDAGHGGADGGAVGKDVLEKEVTLSISLMIRDYLQEQGALVIMTREKDEDLADKDTKGYSRRKGEDLRKRLEVINHSSADMYLSIHLNAIPSPKWSGAQTFYNGSKEENKNLATWIQSEFKGNLNNTNREAKRIQNIYLVENADIPGALVEVGFLSNPTEHDLLKTEEYQKKVAASIYRGILQYLTAKAPPKE